MLYTSLHMLHVNTHTVRACDGSAGKESACNAGDIGHADEIPGLGRPPEGGNGNPLQYS